VKWLKMLKNRAFYESERFAHDNTVRPQNWELICRFCCRTDLLAAQGFGLIKPPDMLVLDSTDVS